MKTIKIDRFQKDLDSLVESTILLHEPITITTEKENIVMISEEDYRGLIETLNLISIPGMKEKLVEGLKTPLSKTVDERKVW